MSHIRYYRYGRRQQRATAYRWWGIVKRAAAYGVGNEIVAKRAAGISSISAAMTVTS